jgi:preprotein translocase subunit SecE
VNRQTKRMMAKQQRQEERAKPRPQQGERLSATGVPKKKRTPPRQFLREVRGELKKVAWPSRSEVVTYTVVVLFSTVFVTLFVFGLDYGFAKGVLKVFGG